jgi:hypothetical protein
MTLSICSKGHFINKDISGVSCVLISHVMFSAWLKYIDFAQRFHLHVGKLKGHLFMPHYKWTNNSFQQNPLKME